MRNLIEVIDTMLTYIPEKEHSLLQRLEEIKDIGWYAAPEVQGSYWIRCAELLEYEIGVPTKSWQKIVASVFVGLPVEEQRDGNN
jgi:hypothetical protein